MSTFTDIKILGEAGNDQIIVDNVAKTINADGGLDTDTFAVGGTVAANKFVLNATTLGVNNRVHTFSTIENLRFDGKKNNDLLTIVALPAIDSITFNGLDGFDKIVGPNTDNVWKITPHEWGHAQYEIRVHGRGKPNWWKLE